ncbi:MAG: peptidyl-prolyl cis-trans isomerase [Gammaproteobacteria bacterium]|nr:peptidyl-prolyl cis-trans isomerase [Gammaproteobacteria bacterium]MCF6361960.1 peptidyl-prolyl cis-trans isomerase [Gammaproteobacteria bacterium]
MIPRILLLVFTVILAACDQAADLPDMPRENSALTPDRDPVLARVGGSEVRQSQMTVLLQRLPGTAIDTLEDETRQKILESLVRMRALAMAAEQQLDEEERLLIDARVQAFRDELLAQKYVQLNMTPDPVTRAMVMDYYDKNLDEFTVKGKVHFQTLVAKKNPDQQIRQKILQVLAAATNRDDWKDYADTLREQGLAVEYREAEMLPEQLPDTIKLQVGQLGKREVSDVIYGKQIEIIKVIARSEDRIRPIAAVSAEIREKLAPMQLKKALEAVSEQVLKKTQVSYVSQSE